MTVPLAPEQVAALRQLRELWRGVPFCMIGASALACLLRDVWRRTHDLDMTVAVSVSELRVGLSTLPGWRRNPRREHEKTITINRQGRKLEITPELLISGTTHVSRPLGDPAKVAGYLARGDRTKLARRLESDVKTLLAFYNFGILHRYVRLRWGFLDEILGVAWALPCDRHIHDILKTAGETRQILDVIVGSAPGWAEPWARARRARVRSLSSWVATLAFEEGDERVDLREIQAVRVVDAREGGTPCGG